MPYDFSTFVRNCAKEQTTPLAGTVTGTIPSWLRGSLVLNGPGKLTFGEQEYQHVFDGASTLQKISFEESGVTFMSRYLRSSAFQVNSDNDQIVVSEFGTKGTSVSNKNAFQKLGEKFSFGKLFSDNAQVGVVKYGGGYYAITESPYLHQIDPKTLETLAKVDLHKELGVNSHCPHPIVVEDGSCINILHTVGATGPKYEIYKFPAEPTISGAFPKPTKIGSVDARWKLNPCLMHSFGLTEHYLVLPEQPLTIDVKAMVANTVKEKPFIEGMEWIKDKLLKLHIVSRETGKEMKFRIKTEPFFFLHIINCYEEENFIVIDFCAFTKPDLLHAFFVKNLRERGELLWKELDRGMVKRLVLPLSVNEKVSPEENLVTLATTKATAHRQKDGVVVVSCEVLSNLCYETPSMNPNFIGRNYSHYYGTSCDMDDNCGKIAKFNVKTKEAKLWSKNNLFACGVHFIPRPGSQGEEDGVLLVPCLHGGEERSQLSVAVLSPATMEELALVTFSTPSDASRTIHGLFIFE